MRLLISARDAGAARNLAPVIQAAATRPGVTLTCCASMPALAEWQSLGIPALPVAGDTDELPAIARSLLEAHRPDAILTGLSGPDAGLDEALLAAAGAVPTFALQDFWGDMNKGFGRAADCYLVLDEAAAELTRARGARAVVVGAPAYAALASVEPERRARRFRRRHGVDTQAPLTGLFSQPLWRHPGYTDTLRQIVGNIDRGYLAVRLHPRESAGEQLRMRSLLHRHAHVPWHIDHGPLWDMIAACDLSASIFSNTNHDRAQLNRLRPRTAGIPVYVMTSPAMRRLYRAWTGLATLPLSDSGVSRTAGSVRDLRVLLGQAATPSARRRFADAARRALPDPGNAPDRALDAILAILAGTTT